MLSKVRTLFINLTRSGALDRDLDLELQSAVDEMTRKFEREGMSQAAARRAALLEMGGVGQVRERARDTRRGISLENTWTDFRYAARVFKNSPSFSVAVVLTFAIGIGANTAIFTAVRELLLAPLPYANSGELVFIWSDLRAAGYPRAPLAGPELKDLRERSKSFTDLGAIWANTAAFTSGDNPEQVRIGLVTNNFFSVLGVRPAIGRLFSDADSDQGAPPTILLSSDLWRRRFGSAESIVGQQVEVNGVPTTVVGVLPDGFKLWMPPDSALPPDLQAFRPFPRTIVDGPRGQQFLRVVGRLRPGITVGDANNDVASVGRQIGLEFADYAASAPAFSAVDLHADVVRDIREPLLALFAGVSVLMILACVNVANLMLARAVARRAEYAMRTALGASLVRLARQSLAEVLILTAAGAVIGVIVARALIGGLMRIRPEALSRLSGNVDLPILAFVAALACFWALIVAIVPLIAGSHAISLTAVIGNARNSGSVTTSTAVRVRALLVGFQVALSVVLLIAAGLFTKTLLNLQSTDLGFSARESITFRVALSGRRYASPDAQNSFNQALQSELLGIPGVVSVGAVSHLPFDNLPNWSTPYRPAEVGSDVLARDADARTITPGYLQAIGAVLLEGRDFLMSDINGHERVAIVDERLAARAWPGQSAVGRELRTDPGTTGNPATSVTVVGVIKHMRHRNVFSEVREQIYFPQRQVFRSPMAYVINSTKREELPGEIRRVISQLDPALPIFEVRPLTDYVDRALSISSFMTALALILAAVAISLCVVGVYGVLAYSTAKRQPEIAIRMAVGASRSTIATLVMREAAAIVTAGAAVGVVVTLLLGRFIEPQLYDVKSFDVRIYAASLLIVAVAATLAAALPTRKAGKVSVLDTLRAT